MAQSTRPSLLDALLGAASNFLVTNLVPGLANTITGAKRVFLSKDGVSGTWDKIDGDYITSLPYEKLTEIPPTVGLDIGDPVPITVGAAMSQGSGALAAANHVHACGRGTPSNVGLANDAGTATTFAAGDHVHALTFSTLSAALGDADSALSVNFQRVTDGADPTNAQDLATKSYVDTHVQGLIVKTPVVAKATSAVGGGTVPSGLGYTVDDVPINTAGMRVLLNNQGVAVYNGIWLAQSGTWTRPSDFAAGSHAAGSYVLVTGGTVNASTGWVAAMPSTGSDIVDTDSTLFRQFSSVSAVGAGAGMTKTGNTLDVVCDDGSITVATDAIRVNSVDYSKVTGAPTSMTPTAHAASHRAGGSDAIGYPSNTQSGLVRAVTNANLVYTSDITGTDTAWGLLADAHVSTLANVSVNKLAKGAAGKTTVLTSSGTTNSFQEPAAVGLLTNPSVKKNGTHRTHRFRDEQSLVIATGADATVLSYTESQWKGDAATPNAAAWDTRATVTVRVQYVDPVSYVSLDRTYKAQLYFLRTGGSWGISGGTNEVVSERLGTPTSALVVSVSLSGTNSGTVNVSLSGYPATNPSDTVVFVDIEGGGNYVS